MVQDCDAVVQNEGRGGSRGQVAAGPSARSFRLKRLRGNKDMGVHGIWPPRQWQVGERHVQQRVGPLEGSTWL